MEEATALSVTRLIEKEEPENLTPEIDTDKVFISVPELNRPALQLAGFFGFFKSDRIQILGRAENEYLKTLDAETVRSRYNRLTESGQIPCIIYTQGIRPDIGMISACHRNGIPLLLSPRTTSALESELYRWLKVTLAPMTCVHGVLVDVYGEGVLITGDSGIGKSEVALELIRRGHRLIADDAVEIRKVSDSTLVGSAPELTRNFLELRGIGVVNVLSMFGVECVKDTQTIDMVIQLEEWKEHGGYDRLGMEDSYIAYLGNRVVCHRLPIRPGRNVAIIVESAAVNNRAKKMGLNAAKSLYDKLQARQAKADASGASEKTGGN